jgi:hypothetical protein
MIYFRDEEFHRRTKTDRRNIQEEKENDNDSSIKIKMPIRRREGENKKKRGESKIILKRKASE